MAGWKSPRGRGAWREWCRRQGTEKGALKEADLGIRGGGSGRAWDAAAAAAAEEEERTRRPRPPAAHHHRRIDPSFSVSVCEFGGPRVRPFRHAMFDPSSLFLPFAAHQIFQGLFDLIRPTFGPQCLISNWACQQPGSIFVSPKKEDKFCSTIFFRCIELCMHTDEQNCYLLIKHLIMF